MTTSTEHLTSEQRKALKRPDEFMTATQGFFERLQGSGKALAGGIAVVAILGAAGVFAYQKREQRLEASKNAFFEAQKALEDELKAAVAALPKPEAPKAKAGEKAPPAPPAPSPDEVLYKKLNPSTTFPKAIAAYQKVITEYPGTRVAFESQIALGNLFLRHGEAAEAASWLKQAAQSAPSAVDQGTAWLGVGAAEESLGKWKEASDAYQSAQSAGDATLRGQALLAMARVQESSKDLAKARATYDQILSQMPGTEAAKAAESAKALLE